MSEFCIPIIQGIQYKKWQGLPSTTDGTNIGQPFVLSDPVPKGMVWLVFLMDAVAAVLSTGSVGTLLSIEGYMVPPLQGQSLPRFAGANLNNSVDKTFFGDYQGINDVPASPDKNAPPIVDAIRTDQSFQGAQSAGVAYHYGESKNLMPVNTPILVLPEDWRLAAYTGLYTAAIAGTIMNLRVMYVQLTQAQANEFLQRGL